jgi:ribosomal small subunit protein bTHX
MGKGDKKSKKGKIWRDSYGKKRNKNAIKKRLKRLASVKKSTTGMDGDKPKVRKPARKKDSAA